jgi:general secretion pathway protein N
MEGVLKWLDDNPLGIALGGLCGFLLLVLLMLTVLAALPPGVATVPPAESGGEGLQLPVLAEKLPIASYAVITERPLFNENRQPANPEGDSSGEPLPLDEPSGAPEVELSGVILTPTLRMVTLKRKDDAKSLVAFEGKPIEADFGSWQVSSIQARKVTLTSGSGEELQLELKVHDAKIEQPVQPVKPEKQNAAASEQSSEFAENSGSEPLSRAEEIRQRIAERREELRREAEPKGQADEQPSASRDQPGEQGAEKADGENYQQAIQALMNRGKKTKNADEQ